MGVLTKQRILRQVELGDHGCPHIVTCYDGGEFENRLFLLMSRAEGQELEKRLEEVPRTKIRSIVDQVAKALIFLRGRSLCHRDVKAANIFVSNDFEKVTLLDLSVLRDIKDHVGIGTDHSNQLPVVATSRYTPPEYLFRLIEPSEILWHGVDIYQLGGLLHDLIMREPMFSGEYASSKENRYRFAWIVARIDPKVSADDVDQDLIFLARRALDKNWGRRHKLRLEDFVTDVGSRSQSLALLGIASSSRQTGSRDEPLPGQIIETARKVDEQITNYLRTNGAQSTHQSYPGSHDLERELVFAWVGTDAGPDGVEDVNLKIRLSVSTGDPNHLIATDMQIAVSFGQDRSQTANLSLPDVTFDELAADEVAVLAIQGIGSLAEKVMRKPRSMPNVAVVDQTGAAR